MSAIAQRPDIRLSLGKLVITPGALDLATAADFTPCLRRHERGDWGGVCEEDARTNDSAALHGGRVISSYTIGGQAVWIITEADRASTCILLPDEY